MSFARTRLAWISAMSFALSLTSTAALAMVVSPGARILEKYSSLYNGDLSVVDAGDNRYLIAESRLGLMLQSSINLKDKENLAIDYLQVMALMTALHPNPEHVFDIGMGGGSLARYHLQKYPAAKVDSAEIDPVVIHVAEKYFFVDDPRHRVLLGRGFDVLNRQSGKYDVIWVDAHGPKEGPTAFMHTSDLNVLRDHLDNDGIIVANLDESTADQKHSVVDKGYKRYYSRGIIVQSPRTVMEDTMSLLRQTVSLPSDRDFLPGAVLAVGNSPDLTCAHFWSVYRRWHKSGAKNSLKWESDRPETSQDICRDLN